MKQGMVQYVLTKSYNPIVTFFSLAREGEKTLQFLRIGLFSYYFIERQHLVSNGIIIRL